MHAPACAPHQTSLSLARLTWCAPAPSAAVPPRAQVGKHADALRTALKLGDKELSEGAFAACEGKGAFAVCEQRGRGARGLEGARHCCCSPATAPRANLVTRKQLAYLLAAPPLTCCLRPKQTW